MMPALRPVESKPGRRPPYHALNSTAKINGKKGAVLPNNGLSSNRPIVTATTANTAAPYCNQRKCLTAHPFLSSIKWSHREHVGGRGVKSGVEKREQWRGLAEITIQIDAQRWRVNHKQLETLEFAFLG